MVRPLVNYYIAKIKRKAIGKMAFLHFKASNLNNYAYIVLKREAERSCDKL